MNSHHSLEALETERRTSEKPYLEVLRVPDLSAGLYVLGTGATDGQNPHSENELYVVLTESVRMQAKYSRRS